MRRVLVILLALVTAAAVPDGNRVRGVVTDESGGVLPGVTVTATGDGRVLGTTTTDGTGRYTLGPLAAGQVTLTFQLDGFATATMQAAIGPTDEVASARLTLAPRSEHVDVVAKLPVEKPSPPPEPPRPRPVMWAVPDHDPAAVCGPAKLESPPDSPLTIVGRRYAANGLYGAGDELTIGGGTADGLKLGDHFVVRRTFVVRWGEPAPIGEHTAGLVQIVAAEPHTAVAVVIYACDEMRPGDRLAAFIPPPRPPHLPTGAPDYRHAAQILFPDDGQMLGAPRRLMVIDGGANARMRPGQHVTLFRRRVGRSDPDIVGDAVVVAVGADWARIRIEHATDVIDEGDLAALQR